MSHPSANPGRTGEEIAGLLLATRGYRLVARNLRVGRTDVDLVLERGRLLVAVEVKWRRANPGDDRLLRAWSPAQRARARSALLTLMAEFPDGQGRPWRYDLVTIAESARGWSIEHHPAAGSPRDSWW